MGEPFALHQRRGSPGGVETRNCLSMLVLDQRELRRLLLTHRPDQHADFSPAGLPCGAPAPLACQDLEPSPPDRPHQDRLHHPVTLQALGQSCQRRAVELPSRLIRVRVEASIGTSS